MENTVAIRSYIDDPQWKYGESTLAEFYEAMIDMGHDGCELPGYDYPQVEAGWLCAIQQRFRELWVKKFENSLDN